MNILNHQSNLFNDRSITLKDIIFDIILEISELLNKEISLDSLLAKIIKITKSYIKAKRISIMKVEGDYLELIANVGFSIDKENAKVKIGESISGKVAEKGEPIVVNNAKEVRYDLGYTTRSYMSIPVKTKEKLIGVLNITDKPGDYFTEDDIFLAKFIGNQCALAIERSYLYNELLEKERLSTIGKLTNTIVHDIKNMLNVISINLELLESDLCENINNKKYGQEDYLKNVKNELDIIRGYVEDILEYSKKDITINEEVIDLGELIYATKKEFQVLIDENELRFIVDIRNKCKIKADKRKFYRVIFNLVNNSIKATEGIGNIRITLYISKDWVYIVIFDNGRGIDSVHLNDLFTPFVSYSGSGTGLGLAISKEIITEHGGDIKVFSKKNRYTYFQIKLPPERLVIDE
ncbi:MAG: GAF domain-containing sensor histidine kinase [Deferribacterota bacterium]|nr:GAF domain-containing sensor histidine kinase [Deferribacterota bacterium]